ncbi:MAG TPA: hypothetical protein VN886_19380 [Acidimicrobiales bacterium]|nr:hypothetical protein [Acidimicrobiales bacterium]
MRAGDRRRFEVVERSLAGTSVYAPETVTDMQLIDALTNRTATPADIKQLYDACAPDLEIRLCQEGAKRRANPDYRRDRKSFQPFEEAAELLRYRADEEIGFELGRKPPFEPEMWLEPEGGRCTRGRPRMPFVFTIWAHSMLVTHLLDRDPLALGFRRRLDEWFDGGNRPVDFLLYPEPREYQLLNPINHPANNCFDLQLLRFPHRDLYLAMGWDHFDDEPEDGHLWTSVDSQGRKVIPSEMDW